MSELKKLNVEGAVVKPPEDAQATYKTIPETNTEYKAVQNSNMVKENGDNCVDGADEKMLSEEAKKLSPKGDLADVKFVTGDQQNGDAKIDIMVIKQGFTGLTKEELLKFSNDPFWVRLRWIMFIGFWLLWLGMLAGAIVIIIGAPKCAPPPPKTWWQQGPLLETDSMDPEVSSLDFKSLEDKLPLLSNLKIKGLFVPATPGEDDYSAVVPTPTDVQQFKRFAEMAKEKNIRVVVDLTPNYMSKASEWFTKSEQGVLPFRDYFVWTDSKNYANEEMQLPNNWLSVDSEQPAWTYSSTRKQFYLHQHNDSTPDLNFRNQDVVNEFSKVLQFWIENGASGIRLSKVKYLLVDPTFANDTSANKPGPVHSQYSYYKHIKTTYQDGLANVLAQWKEVVLNGTDGKGMLMLQENLDSTDSLKLNGTIVVDLPRASQVLTHTPAKTYTAKGLQNSLQTVFSLLGSDSWPSWKFASEDGNLSSELSIITMLLPGVPIVSLDQIVVTSENKTEASDEFNSLATMRSQPSMMYGEYNSYLMANQTIFAYSRLKPGNPGSMVLFNPGHSQANVNLTSIQGVPDKVRVSHLSHNYNEEDIAVNVNLQSTYVPVSPRSVIIISYVPVKKE